MPAARKPQADKYHVYRIDQDLGEVIAPKGANPGDIVNIACSPTRQARGLFIIVNENGSVEFTSLEDVVNVKLDSFSPKDLFT